MVPDTPPATVLLVEDDAGIGRVVRNGLRNHGIAVDWLREAAGIMEMLEARHYNALVLDLMLPDGDGFEICKALRRRDIAIPICMLTARDALDDKLEGFAVGADDYLTKPFAIDELAARLQVLFRRHPAGGAVKHWDIGDLQIDTRSREARVDGKVITLTRREFDVLAYFAAHAGEAISRERLLDSVWHAEGNVASNTVDVYIGYLRKKLAAVSASADIQSVRGVGYKLV